MTQNNMSASFLTQFPSDDRTATTERCKTIKPFVGGGFGWYYTSDNGDTFTSQGHYLALVVVDSEYVWSPLEIFTGQGHYFLLVVVNVD